MENAIADAERIKLIGSSEARAIEAVGNAEAERMRLKATAYKQYGDAAMLSLVLETLPKVSVFLYYYCIAGHSLAYYISSDFEGIKFIHFPCIHWQPSYKATNTYQPIPSIK